MNNDAAKAITKAKGYFVAPLGEQLIGRGSVLVRELCHALELMKGLPEPHDGFSWMPEAYEKVLDALVEGSLNSVTSDTDTVIPQYVWEARRKRQDTDAHGCNFWIGRIFWDHPFDRFKGLLPVIPRDEAESWLNVQMRQERGQEAGSSDAKRKRAGRPKLSKAYALFAAMGFDKGDWSWERTARHIERETGEKPAAKTMRDWAAKASEGRRP